MNVLVIAWNGWQRLMRNRVAMFWTFIGPVIFATFFGVLFKPEKPKPMTVALVNHDATEYLARALTAILERDKVVVTRVVRVEPEKWTLEIPQGAAAAMGDNKPVKLPLHVTAAAETSAERSFRFKIQKALMTIYLQANPGETPADLSVEALERRLAPDDVLRVKTGDLGVKRREVTAGFQRSVPSYLVMFVLLNLLVSGAALAEERASGRLRRMFVAPVRKADIVLGKLLSRFAQAWVQMAYLLLLGVFVFGIRWAEHTWVFLAFLTVYALASASLGMLFGTLFSDPEKCASVAVWTAVLLSPLGGLWWPLEVVGPTMRKVGHIVPTGWAMEGVNSMLAFGAGAREVAPFTLAFLALFAVSFTLAARRLKA